MRLVLQADRCTIYHGDCAELGLVVKPNTVDAIVTDPPAGISFMAKGWDRDRGGRDAWIAAMALLFKPALRALKPGGHAFVWAIPRTSHWMAMALEQAGFQIRDIHHHIFGTGFPKSLNISKAIDEHLGEATARAKIGEGRGRTGPAVSSHSDIHGDDAYEWPGTFDLTAPASPAAARWNGFGTALKPAVEHWILARKPLDRTYAENVLRHGTGALTIAACRIGNEVRHNGPASTNRVETMGRPEHSGSGWREGYEGSSVAGRWPANLSLEHCDACLPGACVIGCPVRELDIQSGHMRAGSHPAHRSGLGFGSTSRGTTGSVVRMNAGGASRFFYIAKASRTEKDAGLDNLRARGGGEATGRVEGSAGTQNPRAGAGRTGGARNIHPTVKSIELMRWLVRLITPPGGLVLDMFAGSGTTGIAALREGCRFIGIELGGDDGEYIPILRGRIVHALEAT